MPQNPLFRPFRALGYITDNVPFAVQRRGKETFVAVSVGKAWQVGHETGSSPILPAAVRGGPTDACTAPRRSTTAPSSP